MTDTSFITNRHGARRFLKELMGQYYCFGSIREAFKCGMIQRDGEAYLFTMTHKTIFE